MGTGFNRNLPKNNKLIPYAKELRKAGNLAEVILWLQLKKRQLCGLDFDRQVVIGNYIVDFYCAEKGLVIEVDGESHNYAESKDEERDEFLKNLGLTVVRVLDIDVKKKLESVMEYIKSYIE